MRVRLLAATFLLAPCAPTRDRSRESGRIGPAPRLGEPCTTGADCADGLTCSHNGASRGQCTVTDCASVGPGPTHGCPEGSFCYTQEGDEGIDCARICRDDEECGAINPALLCEERSATESFGLKVCVLGVSPAPAGPRACP